MSRKRFVLGSAIAVLLGLSVGASVAAPSSARSASVCTPSWQAVPQPAPGTVLRGVAVASPTDAWAIGPIGVGGDLIERWDGNRWRVSQRYGDKYALWSGPTVLTAVAAASPSAAWAVGYRYHTRKKSGRYKLRSQLIERWDGSRWRIDHVPTIPGHSTGLDGVAAVSAKDVWAVGTRTVRPARGRFSVTRTLIEHWDGRAWKIIPSPNIGPVTDRRIAPGWGRGWEPGSDNRLWAVAAVSAHDIWAVGEYALAERKHKMRFYTNLYRVRPLALHWNGTRWSIGPRVNTDSNDNIFADVDIDGFTAVAAAPSGDVLAFEGYYPAGWASHVLWSLRGATSTRVAYPAPFGPDVLVDAITEITHDDAWILGQPFDGGQIVATQWNGQRWIKTSLPAGGTGDQNTIAAAASGPNDIWVVGDLNPLNGPHPNQQVMLHYTC